MGFSYAGVDLNNGTTLRTGYASKPFRTSSRRITSMPFPTAAGGVSVVQPPGPLTIPLAGFLLGEASTLAYRSARDSLLAALGQTRQRLYADFDDNRFLVATPTNIETNLDGPRHGTWSADFVGDDAYLSSVTPSADVRTPTLALFSGTDYRSEFALTPGGTAPAPTRLVIANLAGGVTPTRITLKNASTGELVTLANTSGGGRDLPADSVLVIDPTCGAGWALVSPLTDVIGWWPFLDASGNPVGFGPGQIGLTAGGAGTPLYRQDAPWGTGILFDGASYFESGNAGFDDTGAITFGAWVRPDVASTAMGILGQAESGKGYNLRRTAGNVFEVGIANTTSRLATGTRTVVAGQQYLVGGTATGGTVTLYVQGEAEAETGGGAFSQSVAANNFTVGAPHNLSGSRENWTGLIGEPFFVSRAWTAAEWKTAYRHGIAAVEGVAARIGGTGLSLRPSPTLATNTLQLVASHATTAPTLRFAEEHRARYA